MRLLNAVLLVAVVLAACGSDEPATEPTAGTPPANSGKSPDSRVGATAEEVAKAARGKLRCPAKIETPAPSEGSAVADVVGVRPGMTYDEAANVVLCTNDLLVVELDTSRTFRMNTYGQTLRTGFSARFAEPKIEKSSQEILREMQERTITSGGNRRVQDMSPGQSKWYVGTMGMPGEERVYSAAREEWFLEDRRPSMASVAQALMQKYGTPSSDRNTPGTSHVMTWIHDPLGRPVPDSSPLAVLCGGGFDPDGGINLSPDCGLVVAAQVYPVRGNPDIAEYLQVGVVDQTNGYEVLQATGQGLIAMDAERRARELEEANKNAQGPQL